MASYMDFNINDFNPPVSVSGREIQVTGPSTSFSVFTNSLGDATYNLPVFSTFPAGTYTITLVTNPGEMLYSDDPFGTYVGNPITWVCSGPFQANPTFYFRFLYSNTIRFTLSADCAGRTAVSAEGATVTFDGVAGTAGADSTVSFTTFGGTITVNSVAFEDSTFESGVVSTNPRFYTLPYSVNIGRFLDAPLSIVSASLNFIPPGGCGTGGTGTGGTGVCNLHTPFGFYLRAWVASGTVLARRADAVTPPFAIPNVTVETSGASHPDLYRDETQRGRTYLLYQKTDGNAYRRYSDDDGATWSAAEVAFTGGKYPRSAVCPITGTIVEFAYVSGAIKGRRKYPGDTAVSAEFSVTGLGTVSNNAFGVSWAGDDQRRLLISINNGTSINDFVSTDDGNSFSAVT